MERSHAAAINAATFVNMAGMYSYTTESCPQRFVLRRRLCAAPARCSSSSANVALAQRIGHSRRCQVSVNG